MDLIIIVFAMYMGVPLIFFTLFSLCYFIQANLLKVENPLTKSFFASFLSAMGYFVALIFIHNASQITSPVSSGNFRPSLMTYGFYFLAMMIMPWVSYRSVFKLEKNQMIKATSLHFGCNVIVFLCLHSLYLTSPFVNRVELFAK